MDGIKDGLIPKVNIFPANPGSCKISASKNLDPPMATKQVIFAGNARNLSESGKSAEVGRRCVCNRK